MRKFVSICLAAIVAAVLLIPNVCASGQEIIFTVQPRGGTADNGCDFTVTFETNVECDCMLQMREDETYDWGNINYVTSPFTLCNVNKSFQYRLMTDTDSGDYYSDIFAVTWKNPADLTSVTVDEIVFDSVEYGTAVEPKPVVIRNVGKYALRSVSIEASSDGYYELIQNKEPHDIMPGEVDSETWSVVPSRYVGEGYYTDLVHFHALNVEDNYFNAFIYITVTGGSPEFDYSLIANDIDFGTLPEGGTDVPAQPLTVTVTGSGSLHNVRLKIGEPEFFRLSCTYLELSEMRAGTNSGDNWEIVLYEALPAGYYEHSIEIYADELTEPYTVTVKAAVGENTTRPESGSGTVTGPADITDGTDGGNGGSFPWWALLPVFAAVLVAAVAVTVAIMKKKQPVK